MENTISLESKIEGLLFYKGENVSVNKLSELLNESVDEIEKSLLKLNQTLEGRGLVLIRKDDEVMLGVSKELGSLIELIRKEEITKELSKASLETLSIILYKNGITRSEIDYIRGVNSSFILRNLLIRGLIEKNLDKKDNRRLIYHPSFEVLSFMGISSIDQLPNYTEIKNQLLEISQNNYND